MFIKTLYSGIDFLGWVNFFDHRILRTKTKRRMFKRIKIRTFRRFGLRLSSSECSPQEPCFVKVELFNLRISLVLETINSYLGLLKHGNTQKIKSEIFKEQELDFK